MCCVNYSKLTKVIDINKEMGDRISLLQLIGFMAYFRRLWMEMRWANQLSGEFKIYSQNPLNWAELHGRCGLCCRMRTAACIQWSGDCCQGFCTNSLLLWGSYICFTTTSLDTLDTSLLLRLCHGYVSYTPLPSPGLSVWYTSMDYVQLVKYQTTATTGWCQASI